MAEVVNMAANAHAIADRALSVAEDPPGTSDSVALAAFVAEVGRDIGSDGSFGCLYEDENEPALLFGNGECDPQRRSFDPLAAGAALPPASALPSVPSWSTPDARSGGGLLLSLCAPAGRGHVLIGCWFASDTRVAQRRALRRASALASAIRAVVRLWNGARLADANPANSTGALDALQHGVVLIDREGHVRFVNAAARAIIARRDGLHLHGRMLCANRMGDTARLQAALSHSIGTGAGSRAAGEPVVKIQRDAGRPLIVTVVPHARQHGSRHWLAASAILFDPDEDLDSRIEPVCRLYGLSPVEAKLTCLLAGGACLLSAATTLNVREQTARSYLKQIFVKTGTNRQAQLVSVMLRSAVRTAGGSYAPLL